MKSYLRFTFILLFSIGILILQSSNVWAGLDHNIRGEAYTNEGDFIYFNCLDQPSGSFTYTFTFPLGGDPCEIKYEGIGGEEVSDYGVHLDYSTFVITGHARHEKDGLIYFEHEDPPNYDFINECNEEDHEVDRADCENDNCTACYNIVSQRIHGWAYVVKDDVWIDFDDTKINEADRIKIFNYTSTKAGDFHGFFNYDNFGGKVDLNCNESDSSWHCPPSGSTKQYKVYVGHLEIAEMSAPNWGGDLACKNSALNAILKWEIHGGSISAYEIAISKFNEPDIENDFHSSTKKFYFDSNNYQHTVGSGELEYDTSYYWWLRLHDESELTPTSTAWVQFDHSGDSDVKGILTDNEVGNNISTDPHLTFTTYKHEFPEPYFTWKTHPNPNFIAGAANRFWVKDKTKYYTAPGVSVSLNDPGFQENFSWWGTINNEDAGNKITIVNAVDLPTIANLSLHLDASNIINKEDGDKINQWDDESGGNNNVIQNTVSNQPRYKINAFNGRPAVEFDGSSTFFTNSTFNLEQPFTIFSVTKSKTKFTNAYILDGASAGGASLGYQWSYTEYKSLPDLTGLVLHLDAFELSLDDNDPVSEWLDKSTEENNFIQNDEDKQPIFIANAFDNRPAVRFNGTSTNLISEDLELEQPFTIFAVTKSDEAGSDAFVLNSATSTDETILGYSSGNKWFMWANNALTSDADINDNLSLWTAFYNSDDSFLKIEQDSNILVNKTGDVGSAGINETFLGSSNSDDKYWKGDIAEILIYDGELNVEDIEKIEAYLSEKWGIRDRVSGVDDNKWMMWAGVALSYGTTNHNLSLWTAYYKGDESFLKISQGESPLLTTSGDIGEQDLSGITIGSRHNNNSNWQGYIAEILIYDAALNASQRDAVEEYLKNKWEIIDSGDPVDPKVDVYFESIEDDQRIWLSLTDPSNYTCSTSTDSLNVNYRLPLWREIRARENQ